MQYAQGKTQNMLYQRSVKDLCFTLAALQQPQRLPRVLNSRQRPLWREELLLVLKEIKHIIFLTAF